MKGFLPNIIIILLGTNDANTKISFSSTKFEADYTTLINKFQELTSKPKIWLVKPTPIYDNVLNLSNAKLKQNVIPSIDRVADDLGLPTIDVYTPLLNHSDYFFDGVHPGNEGARIIANEVYRAIVSSKAYPLNSQI